MFKLRKARIETQTKLYEEGTSFLNAEFYESEVQSFLISCSHEGVMLSTA